MYKILSLLLFLFIQTQAFATPNKLRTLQGIDNNQFFGVVFTALDDLNGDGAPEVLAAQVNNQKVFIYSGADGSILKTYAGPVSSNYGSITAKIDDINSDGFTDFAISDISADNTSGRDSGLVHLYSGNPASNYALLFTIELVLGDASDGSAFFGYDVKAVNDVNGDGIKDILIGAPAYNGSKGLARMVSGKDGTEIWTIISTIDNNLGISFAQVGDRNSDGIDDIILGIGGADASAAGKAHIRSGQNGAFIKSVTNPTNNRFIFGCNIESLGDANGDGISDYAVASLVSAPSMELEVKVFSGSNDSVLFTVPQFTQFCVPVTFSAAGDVNQDGYQDLVVGESVKNSGAGGFTIYSGFDGSQIAAMNGTGTDALGDAVASYADYNNDNYPEVLVGQKSFNSNIGGVHIYSAAPELQSATLNLNHNKKGIFEFMLTPTLDISAGGCSYNLYGASKKGKLKPSKITNQKELTSGNDLSSSGMTSSAKLKRKVGKTLANGKFKRGKVHFGASVTCADTTVYTNTISQKVLTKKGKVVPKKKLLNGLAKKL